MQDIIHRNVFKQFANTYSNPMISAINSFDHKEAIAAKRTSSNCISIRGPGVSPYLEAFTKAISHSSLEQQREFLQDKENQKKLFSFIIGILLYYNQGDCSPPIYQYLSALTNLLSLEQSIEESFYLSQGFRGLCLYDVLKNLYSEGFSKTSKIRGFVFEGIKNNPMIEETLFTSESIKSLLTGEFYTSSAFESLKQMGAILFILGNTMSYVKGSITNETILDALGDNIRFASSLFDGHFKKTGVFYASALVGFLDSPHDLARKVIGEEAEVPETIAEIARVEEELRKESISPRLSIATTSSYDRNLDYQQRYSYLMHSFKDAVNRINTLKELSSFHSSSENDKKQYELYQYLSNDENKANYVELLRCGVTENFATRVTLYDLNHPKVTPRLLEVLRPSVKTYEESPVASL